VSRSIYVKGVEFRVCAHCQRAKPPSSKDGVVPYVYVGGEFHSPRDFAAHLRRMADEIDGQVHFPEA
jgi:hypothetical protein